MKCKDLLSFDSKYTRYIKTNKYGVIFILEFLGTDLTLYRFRVLLRARMDSLGVAEVEKTNYVAYLPENSEIISIEHGR